MLENTHLDEQRPIEIAPSIYLVNFHDTKSNMYCNPYLIVEGHEAVLIDGGSRRHFPTVIMKILQTGVVPGSILALVYQHYDPDVCGSILHLEDIIGRDDLKVISEDPDAAFVRHYGATTPLLTLKDVHHEFRFSSGRRLQFINLPHAHTPGSFCTYDWKSGVLFSGDLFGSFIRDETSFLELGPICVGCRERQVCRAGKAVCAFTGLVQFHQTFMPSEKALRYALKQVKSVPFSVIAPQHGSIIRGSDDITLVCEELAALRGVGIDRIVPESAP